ncbi:MAG: AMP-binding protein [Terrimicrobiaceae bacterium]|nr:AMP-binding protein [Terrimicrobiaceae bacterium]
MTTVPEIFALRTAEMPTAEALAFTKNGRDEALTYQQLNRASAAFAANLQARGIRAGDPILVFVPMSPELYVVLLGIFRLGAVAMFVDPSAGPAFIQSCCRQLPPKALVAINSLRWLKPFFSTLRKIPISLPPPRLQCSELPELPPGGPSPNDPALITFTSGSTGRSKAAVRTHEFLVEQYHVLRSSIDLRSGERDLTTLPIFVLANLAAGVVSILPDAKISRPGFIDARRVAAQMDRLKPTRTGGSPAFYQRLATEKNALAKFEKIYTGGAPVFPKILKALEAAAPHAKITAVYGSTEAEPIAHVEISEILDADWTAMAEGRGLLAGRPVPSIQARVIPDQWGKVPEKTDPVPTGMAGEIVVTGPHVLKGYLQGVGDEETKFRMDGQIWHRTGDAGWFDDSGRLWLLGRCSAKIEDSRGTLYPFAVECVAMSFPFIRRAACVAHQNRRLLLVELEPGSPCSPDFEARTLTAGADALRILPRIPVDPRHNAKINYPALRKRL